MCEEVVKEFNGEKIFCRHWKTENDDPKCLVFICHGFGEHCGWYKEAAALLTKENIHVFSHDHIGHGRSGGYQAWIDNYDDYCIPVKMHIEETAKKYSGKKVFIYGHSMGGLVSSRLLVNFPEMIHGLVLESPFLGIPDFVPQWQVKIGLFLGRTRYLDALPVSKVDASLISHDPSIVQGYLDDPLNFHGGAKARWVAHSMDAKDEVFEKAKSLKVPLLICHGDADKICPISESKRLHEEASSDDKTFKNYPGAYHQLHTESFEDVKNDFYNTVISWINQRC